ncbi:MAG TPA: glycosyltransferase, partial [Nitrospirae bacterium]|nr:glycosyltransferase [Nitrospirota bacterium]
MTHNQSPIPLVSIIIPNLNGIKYLPGCLASLNNQTYNEYEIIVIDNGSKDGSIDFVKAEFPQIIIIGN